MLKLQLKLLKHLTNVKQDGTVQFDVPEVFKTSTLDFGTGVSHNGSTHEEILSEEIEVLPPLQIVMLIVGTRGDVQPFLAIGKRLQVACIFWILLV